MYEYKYDNSFERTEIIFYTHLTAECSHDSVSIFEEIGLIMFLRYAGNVEDKFLFKYLIEVHVKIGQGRNTSCFMNC